MTRYSSLCLLPWFNSMYILKKLNPNFSSSFGKGYLAPKRQATLIPETTANSCIFTYNYKTQREVYKCPGSCKPSMLFTLDEHKPWNHVCIMGPIMSELMPPFFQYDFIFTDFVVRPQFRMRFIETISICVREKGYNIV